MATFLQMQTTLSHLLGENGVGDGYWTQAEKQRMINEGILDVVVRTLQNESTTTFSTQDGVHRYSAPSNMLLPRKMYIDGKPYRRISLEQYVELVRGDLDDRVDYSTADNARDRYYVWNRDAGTFDLLPVPGTTASGNGLWYYLKAPATLSATTDESEINDVLHHLPPLYAAWKLAYRDKEHRNKGLQLREEYAEGIATAVSFLNLSIDDSLEPIMGLDPAFFSNTGFPSTRDFDQV